MSEHCGCVHGWGFFLHVRHLLITEWLAEGRSEAEIAEALSMDSMQVKLIGMTPIKDTHMHLERKRR